MKRGKNLIETVRYEKVSMVEQQDDRNIGLTNRKREFILKKPVLNKKVAQIFYKARIKLKGVLAWKKVLSEIHEFGLKPKNRVKDTLNDSTGLSIYSIEADRFLFYPETTFKKYWNFLVLLMICYVLIGMPWVTAFEDEQPWTNLFIFEITLDCLFFFDILVTFNSAYYRDRKLIANRWEIAKNYITGLFFLDLLSIMPFYLLTSSNSSKDRSNTFIRMIRITKIIRIFRASKISKIVEHFSDTDTIEYWKGLIINYRGTSRLFSSIFVILIIGHIAACFWYFLAKIDDFGLETWVSRYGWLDEPKEMLYLRSLYFTFTVLTTVGFGDIVAFTIIEMIFCILLMLVGIFFYSYLIGTLSSLISSIDARAIRMSAKIDFLEKFCKENYLPESVFRAMKKFVKSNGENEIMDEEKRISLINSMPRKMRYEIAMEMFGGLPKQVFFFNEQSEGFIIDIVPRLNLKILTRNEFAYKKGEHPTGIYFIGKGRVSFLYYNDLITFKTMIEGSYFGEIEIIEKELTKFSACSDTETHLLVMSESLWYYLESKFPEVSSEIYETARLKHLKNNQNLQEIIDVLEVTEIRKIIKLEDLCGKERIRHKVTAASKQISSSIKAKTKLSFEVSANIKIKSLLSQAKLLLKSVNKIKK